MGRRHGNEQAEAREQLNSVRHVIGEALATNELFELAARPKKLMPIMISRYSGGEQRYGTHVDEALMRGVPSDLSFRLFLADPGSYDGGELVIEQSAGEHSFKLEHGAINGASNNDVASCRARDARLSRRRIRIGAQLRAKCREARDPQGCR